jgi:hypothetical protein
MAASSLSMLVNRPGQRRDHFIHGAVLFLRDALAHELVGYLQDASSVSVLMGSFEWTL